MADVTDFTTDGREQAHAALEIVDGIEEDGVIIDNYGFDFANNTPFFKIEMTVAAPNGFSGREGDNNDI